jgi:hypothetical protein
MYRGFEINLTDWDINPYHLQGVKVFNFYQSKVTSVLDTYLKQNKSLDGEKMREDWFPQVGAEIFISHSHSDQKLAISLAGWLYDKFNLLAFIDSMIWGYADDLLIEIDNRYCLNQDEKTYNYRLRNYSTSHVHMMLSTALNKMIDKTECFFFLKTSNSINTERAITQPNTYSPWIYSEIEISRLIRKKPLKEYREISKAEMRTFSAKNQEFLNESLKIEYPVYTEHLECLSTSELKLWSLQNAKEKWHFPLDRLYANHPLNKLL